MIKKLTLPFMITLFAAVLALGLFYRGDIHPQEVSHKQVYATEAVHGFNIIINGDRLTDAPPAFIRKDKLYLPLRAICETCEYTVTWNGSEESILTSKGKTEIHMSIGSDTAEINKKEYKLPDIKTLSEPLFMVNDITYVYSRDMADIFNIKIKTYGERSKIDISYSTQTENYISFNDGMGKTTLPIKYSDSYFQQPAYEYSREISELCAALSSAAYNWEDLSKAYDNMGFSALFFNYDKTDRDSSAYSIASKLLSDGKSKLYITAVRGTSGEEWYTNFDIYKDQNTPSARHYGFDTAEKSVKASLEEYLEQDNFDGKRIFVITGHSRGAAVANLLAADLTKEARYAAAENIYCYTFATPNVSVNYDADMKNIYNFCNDSDFITRIPFGTESAEKGQKEWAYGKNGTVLHLDVSDIGMLKTVMDTENEFRLITGHNFTEIDKSSIDAVTEELTQLLPTVRDYYTKKLSVGNQTLTAYDFFVKGLAASQMSGSSAESGMLIIAGGLLNGDLSSLSRFLAFNSSPSRKENDDGSITESGAGIKHNHSCEVYYAFVKAYNKHFAQ